MSACTGTDQAATREAGRAVDRLCHDYWPPLYSFVRRRGYKSQDAQDIVQGFFAFLLENQAYARADCAKGKFRTFLLAALKNYLSDARDHEKRLKRGGGQSPIWLDAEDVKIEEGHAHDLQAPPSGDEEKFFERRWAMTIVTRALDALAVEFAQSEHGTRTFTALKPFLSGGTELRDPAEVAAELGVTVENLRNQISRLRVRFRDNLRQEIARTVSAQNDLDEEMRYLLRVLLAST